MAESRVVGLGDQSDDDDYAAYLRGEEDARAAGEHDDDEGGEDDPEEIEEYDADAADPEGDSYMRRVIRESSAELRTEPSTAPIWRMLLWAKRANPP